MRKFRVKFDEKECGGQLAVECGDDPPGGLSTLSAHQMAHGGVIPHSSSSELSAHQMPTRLTSAPGHDGEGHTSTKITPPIWGKDRERTSARTHDVSAAPHPDPIRLFNEDVVGPGFVGPDAKAMGPRPARHPSGPRGSPA